MKLCQKMPVIKVLDRQYGVLFKAKTEDYTFHDWK